MPRTTLCRAEGSAKAWSDDDKFVALFIGVEVQAMKGKTKGKGKTKPGEYLRFLNDHGVTIERWVTTKWAQLISDKVLKPGMILSVKAGEEQRMKGGRRFRGFEIELLTGKEIPSSLRK